MEKKNKIIHSIGSILFVFVLIYTTVINPIKDQDVIVKVVKKHEQAHTSNYKGHITTKGMDTWLRIYHPVYGYADIETTVTTYMNVKEGGNAVFEWDEEHISRVFNYNFPGPPFLLRSTFFCVLIVFFTWIILLFVFNLEEL